VTDLTFSGSLKDVVILSIAGGNRDIQISSDLSYLDGIVAPSHGLSVVSTQIPNVWLSTDHLVFTIKQKNKIYI
jgi:hypothetical protein